MQKAKSTILGLCTSILSLLLSGCQGSQTDIVGGDSKAAKDVLSNTTSLTADLPNEVPESLYIYQVDYYQLDEAKVLSSFIQSDAYDTSDRAEGKQFTTDAGEYLCLLDDCAGFTYYHFSGNNDQEEEFDIHRWVNKDEASKEMLPEYRIAALEDKMQSFDADKELSFLAQNEAQEMVEQAMQACAFPEAELHVVLPRSADTLNANRELYNETMTELRKEVDQSAQDDENQEIIDDAFSTEDEDYVFIYRQMIDGVPVTSDEWRLFITNPDTFQEIRFAVVEPASIGSASIIRLYEVQEAVRKVKIIAPTLAAEKMADYCGELHFAEETEITEMELNYIIIKNGDELEARPAWVFHTKTKRPNDDGVEYYECRAYAINAETGVLLEKVTDTR